MSTVPARMITNTVAKMANSIAATPEFSWGFRTLERNVRAPQNLIRCSAGSLNQGDSAAAGGCAAQADAGRAGSASIGQSNLRANEHQARTRVDAVAERGGAAHGHGTIGKIKGPGNLCIRGPCSKCGCRRIAGRLRSDHREAC